MVLKKYEIEQALHAEKQDIAAGRLKEDNPLDTSDTFRLFCEACRRGDLKVCQEKIAEGVNINARDRYDYTPLILASLCGHYEVVQHLLESGALCERDTFQGERCLYNALNDKIRNLLLAYDYSKSTDPLQPLAAHITSLLSREEPQTSDIVLNTYDTSLNLHKFILAARSPYFAQKLEAAPETATWKLSQTIATESFETVMRYLYMGDVSASLGSGDEEQEILRGIDKLSRQLEIPRLFETLLEGGDRRTARQRRTEEIARGRDQMASWFQKNVLDQKIVTDIESAENVSWDRNNPSFADVLLWADDEPEETEEDESAIPVGPLSSMSLTPRKATLFPVHRAMLLRSEFFATMFASSFLEAQSTSQLTIIPIDCSPAVLEIVLTFLYTERAEFGLELAVDVLFAADLLFVEKLKQRAAMIISTLGSGQASVVEADNARGDVDAEDVVDIYEVIRAGWDTRVHRLEEFGARFIAYRLERFIDDPEFAVIVRESASRIKRREETDTVELVDDIRYYLSERFRLRFEDSGLDDLMDENGELEGADKIHEDEGVDFALPEVNQYEGGVVRTLDGEIAGDEFAQDAMNYQILLGKIDALLEGLEIDA